MSTTDDKIELTESTVLAGSRNEQKGRQIYNTIVDGWDLRESYIGDGQVGVNLTKLKRAFYKSNQEISPHDDGETILERMYGTRHPFVAASLIGSRYEEGGGARDADAIFEHTRDASPDNERALVDDGIVKAASPIEVDPMIVDIQRSAAPILDIIPAIAQPGFTAQYNVFDGRTLNDFFVTEADAADLSDNTGSEFSVTTATKDMKIMATLLNVSDFSQRAEETLDYMNLMDTTVGQVTREYMLNKAKAFLYGDPDGGGTGTHESTEAFEGLASFADTGGNVVDKTGTSGGYMENIMSYLVDQVTSSGLSFSNAGILTSPQFYQENLYGEVTPVVRVAGYEADVEYGPGGFALNFADRGSVPITPIDNIRDYSSESSGVGSNSTTGDVFIYDQDSIQYRQLAPTSTVPLGRLGLADRAALFEYGTLIDKSQGNHTHRLRYGAV